VDAGGRPAVVGDVLEAYGARPFRAAARLMVIFSAGGLALASRLQPQAVRCLTGFVPTAEGPAVTFDRYPGPGRSGLVEDGEARLMVDGEVRGSRPLAAAGLARRRARWDDLDVLAFAGTALWTWIVLPLVLDDERIEVRALPADDEGRRRLEVSVPAGWPATSGVHVLHIDGEGRIVRHDERVTVLGRQVAVSHEVRGHCEFEGVLLAIHRRTRGLGGAPVLWTDVVAAHVIPRRPG
jgi:hypothetical protein